MDNVPLLHTRDVLRGHLHAKVLYIESNYADKFTDIIFEESSNEQILRLLSDDSLLEDEVDAIFRRFYGEDKEMIGTELFNVISVLEPDLCPQLTGMLLELPTSAIKELLSNKISLHRAIERAKTEYLLYVKDSSKSNSTESKIHLCNTNKESLTNKANKSISNNKSNTEFNRNKTIILTPFGDKLNMNDSDAVGEFIYNYIVSTHPLKAGKLTGMLLQMDKCQLIKVVSDVKVLDEKVDLALQTLTQVL